MHTNESVLERQVQERRETRRATARRAVTLAAARRPRGARARRIAPGHALVRLRRSLPGEPARRTSHA